MAIIYQFPRSERIQERFSHENQKDDEPYTHETNASSSKPGEPVSSETTQHDPHVEAAYGSAFISQCARIFREAIPAAFRKASSLAHVYALTRRQSAKFHFLQGVLLGKDEVIKICSGNFNDVARMQVKLVVFEDVINEELSNINK